jgi:hypothetical protein
MFGITSRQLLQGGVPPHLERYMEVEYEPGEHEARRLQEEGFRSSAPLGEFAEVVVGTEVCDDPGCLCGNQGCAVFASVCPVCGSTDVDSESHGDYGGTSCGSDSCNFCGYTTAWSDISAVI